MASTAPAPVGSTSQPASNPAIQQAQGKKPAKEKKAAAGTGSAYPLEVCEPRCVLTTLSERVLDADESSAGILRS